MFRKKSLRKLAVFRVVLQNKGKKRVFLGKSRKKGIFREHDPLVMRAAWEIKRSHIVGKRSLGGAKQGQENRENGARRTETRVSYDWEAIFSLLYI